ncbi:MAG: hypothetical protein ACRCXL_13705 [Dermatophilaceae bacterium]
MTIGPVDISAGKQLREYRLEIVAGRRLPAGSSRECLEVLLARLTVPGFETANSAGDSRRQIGATSEEVGDLVIGRSGGLPLTGETLGEFSTVALVLSPSRTNRLKRSSTSRSSGPAVARANVSTVSSWSDGMVVVRGCAWRATSSKSQVT